MAISHGSKTYAYISIRSTLRLQPVCLYEIAIGAFLAWRIIGRLEIESSSIIRFNQRHAAQQQGNPQWHGWHFRVCLVYLGILTVGTRHRIASASLGRRNCLGRGKEKFGEWSL